MVCVLALMSISDPKLDDGAAEGNGVVDGLGTDVGAVVAVGTDAVGLSVNGRVGGREGEGVGSDVIGDCDGDCVDGI